MDLNNLTAFQTLDPEQMIAHIDALPEQLQQAWQLGSVAPLPSWDGIRQVLIAGMGGSAIGGDLLAAYATPMCSVPIVVHRNYGLPAWARGAETLVIAASHSGNTEEVLDALDYAIRCNCRILVISRGGALTQAAESASVPVWRFVHDGQPRAAVGFSFGLLLAAFHRLGLIANPADELRDAVAAMKTAQNQLRAEVPAVHNPAKRLAGQLVGRLVAVLGSDILAPVARRWKTQINELAKAWGHFEELPEADHNLLAGSINPQEAFNRLAVLFLQAPSDHPRNRRRSELTRKILMLNGISTDTYQASGETRLAHLWTTLHFGDYTAYYLAMAYQVNPTPVDAIESLKKELLSNT